MKNNIHRNSNGVKLLFFTPSDILVPRVDRQCNMRFCEALAELGINIELVSLNVRLLYDEPTKKNAIWETYGIRTPFPIIILPTSRTQNSGNISAAVFRSQYSLYVLYKALLKKDCGKYRSYILFFKCYSAIIPLLFLRRWLGTNVKIIKDQGTLPKSWLKRWVLKNVDGIVANTYTLAKDLKSVCGISPKKIIGMHQGVNLDYIQRIRITRQDARKKLGLPLYKKIVVYTGKVSPGFREVELLLKSAKLLPDISFVIAGGRSDSVEYYRHKIAREELTNIEFVGFIPPSDIYYYQFAADVLVLYYSKDAMAFDYYRSPGKLFDYMASRTPIVCADYPVLKEILVHEANAVFVEPESPRALASGITRILFDRNLSERISEKALKDVKAYTWKERAEKIIKFCAKLDTT